MVSKNTVNYLRLLLLNVEGGTLVLREVITKEVKNSSANGNLDNYLTIFKTEIDVLKKKRFISLSAYKTLFPDDGSNTDLLQWDVSLLCIVLLQCCSLEGKLGNLQEIIQQEVQSSKHKDLDLFLLDNKGTIESLRGTDLTAEQYNKLFPTTSQTRLDNWDIGLLIVVLLNLCKQSNADKVTQALRKAVITDIVLCDSSQNTDVYLQENLNTITKLKDKGELTDSQFAQLYPVHGGKSDIANWDIRLLQTIVMRVCKSLPPNIIGSIKAIKNVRNKMIAHTGKAEIDNDDFLGLWTDLYGAIKNILVFVPHIEGVVLNAIAKFTCGALDVQSAEDTLKTFCLKDESLKDVILKGLASIEESANLNIQRSEANIKHHIDQKSEQLDSNVIGHMDTQFRGLSDNVDDKIGGKMDIFSEGQAAMMKQISLIVSQLDIKVPETSVELTLKNCTEDKEKLVCEKILEIFTHKLHQEPEYKDKDKDKEHLIQTLKEAMSELLADGKQLTGAETKCVIMKIRCPSVQSLFRLWHDCVNGTNTVIFRHVQQCLRRFKGCADLGIEVIVRESEFWHCMDIIVNELSNALPDKTQDEKQAQDTGMEETPIETEEFADNQISIVVPQKSRQAGTHLRMRIQPRSVKQFINIWQACTSGRFNKKLEKVAEAMKKCYGLTDLHIDAKLDEDLLARALTETIISNKGDCTLQQKCVSQNATVETDRSVKNIGPLLGASGDCEPASESTTDVEMTDKCDSADIVKGHTLSMFEQEKDHQGEVIRSNTKAEGIAELSELNTDIKKDSIGQVADFMVKDSVPNESITAEMLKNMILTDKVNQARVLCSEIPNVSHGNLNITDEGSKCEAAARESIDNKVVEELKLKDDESVDDEMDSDGTEDFEILDAKEGQGKANKGVTKAKKRQKKQKKNKKKRKKERDRLEKEISKETLVNAIDNGKKDDEDDKTAASSPTPQHEIQSNEKNALLNQERQEIHEKTSVEINSENSSHQEGNGLSQTIQEQNGILNKESSENTPTTGEGSRNVSEEFVFGGINQSSGIGHNLTDVDPFRVQYPPSSFTSLFTINKKKDIANNVPAVNSEGYTCSEEVMYTKEEDWEGEGTRVDLPNEQSLTEKEKKTLRSKELPEKQKTLATLARDQKNKQNATSQSETAPKNVKRNMDDDDAEDDIAIIGVGCRYPGADNIEEFWQVLVNEENHVLDIPQERWNNDAFFDEDKNAHRKLYTRKAGFLKRHDEWDNHVFGISDIEASRVDPQQRYVLECVHMAMEDGGITRHCLNGSRTGVYMGSMNNDYKSLMKGETSQKSYSSTGMSPTLIAARVSYVFNLTGPCLVLDTACSSSLMAIHLGCQALRSGDCDLAICGGVNSILTPETFFPLCENHMMSTIGQCQTFCDTADGYARGEGCGVVILQLVKEAVRERNKIWATIKTGTNQDGCAVHPITAPSGEQQRELLESTYKRYHIDPCDVQYIEAHGTGTPIGDPTEVNALGIFFSKHRTQRCLSEALLIGSVKSNIGHTESAAGVAGLIKVLLMMKHGSIVPTLHVKKDKSNVNKAILFEKYGLDIALQPCTWPLNKNNKRVACINSFGFGGSNCHAVLTQVNKSPDERKGNIIADLNIACISVYDEQSLKLSLEAFQRDIETSYYNISDICYTSCCRRDHLTSRIALVGRTKQEIQSVCKLKLSTINQRQHRHDEQNIVFVYCGVGTTWTGMCREMMSKVDVFRETIEVIDSYLLPLCGWRIGDKFRENTNYDDPFLNHIAIFSSQVALSEVWKRWGVQPDAIVGMSVGEVAAAYGSGNLSIQDAVKVIYHRSKILAGQTGGAMMVVMNLEVPKVETLCKQYQHQAVCVAVYSSPISCTISGNANEIDNIKETLVVQGKKANMRPIYLRKLNVQCAYHSPKVENCREEVIKQIGNLIDSTDLTTQHISTVTGNIAAHGDFKTGEYWAGNVTKPVLLMQGIRKTLKQNTRNIFIEIGPRPVLRPHLSNILPDGINGLALASMRDNTELQSMYLTLSELYELGIDISWNTIYKDSGTLTPIPRYVFNKMKTLHVSDTAKLYLAGVNSNIEHSHLFIRRSASSQGHNQFQLLVNHVSTPFVYDHFLSGVVLVPGATYVEMGFHIGIECMKQPINNLTVSIEFEKPFTPKPDHEYSIDVSTTAVKDGGIMFKATSNARVLCTGEVSLRTIPERPSLSIEGLRKKLTKQIEKKECYANLEKLDFQYGERLSMIERAWSSDTECLAEILVSDYVANDFVETHIHPAVFDAFFQTFGICIASTGNNYAMPKGASAIVVDRPLKRKMYAYASQIYKTDSGCSYNAVLLTPNGSVISEVNDFTPELFVL